MDHTILPPKSLTNTRNVDVLLPREELGRLTGIVARLASADSGEWPEERNAQDVLEVRVARRLDVALSAGGRDVLDAYHATALRLLSRALRAYRIAGRK